VTRVSRYAPRPMPTGREVILRCLFAAATALMCGSLLAAAVLVPAPPGVLPVVIVASLAMPMVATWQAAVSISARREASLDGRALRELRRQLARLPEVQHPLGL